MSLKTYSDRILLWTFVGIILGCVGGVWLGPQMVSVAILGTLFLNALKMLVIPLVFASLVVGVTNIGDIKTFGREGGWTIFYYMLTTGVSVLVGILLVNFIEPGRAMNVSGATIPESVSDKTFSFLQVIEGIVPDNILKSMVQMDVLPVIFFALFAGLVLATMGKRAKPLVEVINVANDLILKMVHIVILFAPVGVFGLIGSRLGEAGGAAFFTGELARVGLYSFTVVLGLAIHGLIALPLFLLILGKRNPFVYAKNVLEALLTAFSTASSSATLPVTMECVEKRNGISNRVAGFVLPLGATINMDGTALYEAVAAIFIAQAFGYDLSMFQQVVIFFTATLAAIGAAGIPQAGLVTMIVVLKAVGLPLEGIALLLSVDWLLDRFRTSVNVWGDAVVAAMVEQKTSK